MKLTKTIKVEAEAVQFLSTGKNLKEVEALCGNLIIEVKLTNPFGRAWYLLSADRYTAVRLLDGQYLLKDEDDITIYADWQTLLNDGYSPPKVYGNDRCHCGDICLPGHCTNVPC